MGPASLKWGETPLPSTELRFVYSLPNGIRYEANPLCLLSINELSLINDVILQKLKNGIIITKISNVPKRF